MAISPLVAHSIGNGDKNKPLVIAINGLFVAFFIMLFLGNERGRLIII
jgi:hypothetical protein